MDIRPKVFCVQCYDSEEYELESSIEVASVREVTFPFLETRARCKNCGQLVYVPAINDKNVYERHKAYYKALEEQMKNTKGE